MFKALVRWLKKMFSSSQLDQQREASLPQVKSNSQMAEQFDSINSASHLVPYDENLLERARTQWQFGDWHSLAKLDRETLQHHPERAKLVLLAAAGRLQIGQDSEVRQYIRLAQDWGCSKKHISQILISGVYNSLGTAIAYSDNHIKLKQYFENAIKIGSPGSEFNLLSKARIENHHANIKNTEVTHQIKNHGNQLHPKKDEEIIPKKDIEDRPLRFKDEYIKEKFSNHLIIINDSKDNSKSLDTSALEKLEFKLFSFSCEIFIRHLSNADKQVCSQIFERLDYDLDWLQQGKSFRKYLKSLTATNITPLFIDCGANIGASLQYFKKKYPSIQLLAVEPDIENCELIKINAPINNTILFNGAISDNEDGLLLIDPGNGEWAYRTIKNITPNTKSISVPLIFSYFEQDSNIKISLIKIDIEGAEKLIFSKNTYWMENLPVIIIELHDWMLPFENSSKEILHALSHYGYEVIPRGENLLCFNPKILK